MPHLNLWLSKLLILAILPAFGQGLSIRQAPLRFDETNELQRDSLPLTLVNEASEAVKIKEIRFYQTYGQAAFYSSLDTTTLAPGDSIEAWVYFAPRHNVYHNSEMLLVTQGPGGDLSIDLQGQGAFSQSYYASSQNLSEAALKSVLKNRISQGYQSLGYTIARNEMFLDIDNRRTNGQGATVNTLACVYTGTLATGYATRTEAQNQGFNTEHTFPQGFFNRDEPMRSDLFHLFPTTVNSNSTRASLPFGTVTNPQWQVGGSRQGNGVFEPKDDHKGAVARAMLYFVLRYQDYNNFLAGQETRLREWHCDFPPDTVERRRNDAIADLQNNRNPFIDYPQFLDRIQSVSGASVGPEDKLIDLGQGAVNFGQVFIGEEVTHRWIVINTGNVELNISGMSLDNPQVRFSGISGADTTLTPGEALTIGLVYRPTEDGSFSAQLNLDTDAQNTSSPTLQVPLLANAITDIPDFEGSPWRLLSNPSRGKLLLKTGQAKAFEGKLVDLQGRRLASHRAANAVQVDWALPQLSSGTYYLLIEGQTPIKVILR
ncbi:MAG: endonuclease [Bacteroidota bacterium]